MKILIDQVRTKSDLVTFFNVAHRIIREIGSDWEEYDDAAKYTIASKQLDERDILYQVKDRINNILMGILWLKQKRRYIADEKCIFVYYIHVNEEYRGKGIGSELMEFTEEVAKEHGLGWIELSTRTYLEPALNMYKKLGYEEIEFLPTHVKESTTKRFYAKKIIE